jgi:hypothetical protein
MKTYVVNWQGPFNDDEIENLKTKFGLYLITGYEKRKRTKKIHYCGITSLGLSGRIARHHKKDMVTREREYWIGQIVAPDNLVRDDLEFVESLIVYFWDPTFNEKKTKNPPHNPTAVINRWYDKDNQLILSKIHEVHALGDVIFWDGQMWHLGNLDVYLH